MTPKELAPEWERRACEHGLDRAGIAAIIDRTSLKAPCDEERHDVARELAGPHGLTSQAAHFDRRDVIQAFAERAQRGANLTDIDAFVESFLADGRVVPLTHDPGKRRRRELIRLRDGRVVSAGLRELRYSTPEMLEVERQVIDTAHARRGRGGRSRTRRRSSERWRRGRRSGAIRRRWCASSASTPTGSRSLWARRAPARRLRSTLRARRGERPTSGRGDSGRARCGAHARGERRDPVDER